MNAKKSFVTLLTLTLVLAVAFPAAAGFRPGRHDGAIGNVNSQVVRANLPAGDGSEKSSSGNWFRNAEEAPKASDALEAASDEHFSIFLEAFERAGLAEVLGGDELVTVLAPTNEAFAKLPEGTLEELFEDIPRLRALLLQHVIDGAVTSKSAAAVGGILSQGGEVLDLRKGDGALLVANARVLQGDVRVANGIIHVVNEVVFPYVDLMAVDGETLLAHR